MIATQLLILGIFIGIPIGLMISLAIAGNFRKQSKQLYERED